MATPFGPSLRSSAGHRRRCRGSCAATPTDCRYRATTAHALAYQHASRPKPGKLVQNLELRGKVEAELAKKYSPGADRGPVEGRVPDQAEMQVSTETIYQSLYVQSRGALKRDLTRYLRTGQQSASPAANPGNARTASRT